MSAQSADVDLKGTAFACINSFIDIGHQVATVGLDDRLAIRDIKLGNEALALVKFKAGGSGGEALLPLEDSGLGRLIRTGAEIVEVGAPPKDGAVMWFAGGFGNGYAVAAVDQRGVGLLSMSSVITHNGRPLGSRLQSWWERSGVSEVNDRRRDVMKELYRSYGNEAPDHFAQRIAMGARVEAILDWYRRHGRLEWLITGPDGFPMARGTPALEKSVPIADAILDAISTEAVGGTRASLPRAQAWTRSVRLEAEVDLDHGRGIVGEAQVRPADGWTAAKIQLHSDWTLQQTGHSATSWLAIALADGTVPLGTALAAGIGSRAVVNTWASKGLTRRQIQVMFATGMGHTDAEIGDRLKIAKSTVRNTRSKARQKIFKCE